MRDSKIRSYKNNKESTLAGIKKWSQNNPDRVVNASRRYRANSSEKAKAAISRYWLNNMDKKKAGNRLWRQMNGAKMISYNAKRRAQVANAMPPWANVEDIVAVYQECSTITKATGIKHEVDHIVPLTNEIVCGLHVSWNLQVLTKVDNRDKWNNFVSDWD